MESRTGGTERPVNRMQRPPRPSIPSALYLSGGDLHFCLLFKWKFWDGWQLLGSGWCWRRWVGAGRPAGSAGGNEKGGWKSKSILVSLFGQLFQLPVGARCHLFFGTCRYMERVLWKNVLNRRREDQIGRIFLQLYGNRR